MRSFFESWFAQLLRRLANLLCVYPKWFVYPQFFLFILCIFYTAHGLKLDMSRDNLVGAEKKYQQTYLKFKKEFPTQDELAVVVESENLERNRQFVERLGVKLEQETNLFTDVFYKGDLKMLGPKALLFVPEEDLAEMKKTLREFEPFIQKFTHATNLNSLFALVNKEFATAKREENAQNKSLVKAIPALERIAAQAADSLSRPGAPPSPGVNALFGAGDEALKRLYITFADGRIFLVTARAKSERLNEKAVERMRQLMQETQFEVPGLNVGLTGEPVLEYDEMNQSKHDSIVASIAALIVSALIFIYAYRQTGRPLKTVVCLVIGLGYTMGFTTLAIGHLNILTITFAPILIGLAIDFGIHFITRYEEEMRHGRTESEAMEKAMVYTGQGIITGALTTAGAFLAMGLTDFKGIQEMGIISGGGLMLCLIPMMTMLPVLLMRGRQNVIDREMGAAVQKRVQIENLWLQRPVLVLLITVVLVCFSALQFSKVFFDYNLLNMQSKGLPAVIYEKKLINADQSVLFAAVIADSSQEAQTLEEKIKKLPSVASVVSMTDFTQNQEQKLKLAREIKRQVADIHVAEVDPNGIDLHELGGTLYSLMGYLGLSADEAQKEDTNVAGQLRSLREAIAQFRVKMLSDNLEIPERLYKFQQALFVDIRETFDAIKNQDTQTGLRPQDLPPALRNRFVGVTGKLMLQVFPKGNVWQHEVQREFIKDLRSVVLENKVTGTPVQLYEYTTLLKDSYEQAALYSLGAIAIMVFIHFRSLLCVILSLLPVGIGTAWLLGFMGKTGVPFNPANIMTLPLVIGIGVTNGIHILNRFAEEKNPGILAKSTGKAVLVSGLTAITGFGSLMLAKHQGIQSLGFVMSVGIAACMIAGLTFLPALLQLLVRRGWMIEIKKPSGDNAKPSLGPEEPR